MPNPYQVLGVSPLAGPEEIKSAFRRLAKTYHPDAGSKDPKNHERFHEVATAYDLLRRKAKSSDPASAKKTWSPRASFTSKAAQTKPQEAKADSAPSAEKTPPVEPEMPPSFDAAPQPETPKKHAAFSDFLSSLRKIGRRAFRSTDADHPYDLSIPFLDAVSGTRRRLTLRNGKSLDVHIPAGVEDGQQIRLRGQGEVGLPTLETGDAIVTIAIAPHPVFRREGADIHTDTAVTLPEAVLGTKLNVPTVDGDVALTVPAGSNSGTVLRLKGKGLPYPPGKRRLGRGDQYVSLVLVLPPKPDDALKDFVATWAAGLTHKPRKS